MRHYFAHVIRSKGLANVLPRAMAIGRNFGFTEARIARKLAALGELTARHNAPLTACVTACLVERYPRVVGAMRRRGWEIAVHGKVHCDFRQLDAQRQTSEMRQAIELYRRRLIEVSGFRAPYLAWNEGTRAAAAHARFRWTSNHALLWPVLARSQYRAGEWGALRKVLEHLYRPRLAEQSVSVPQMRGGVVEIPVSLPDDEILLDRLRLPEATVARLWLRVLEESRGRGELAVLLIHHERMPEIGPPLEEVLNAARAVGRSLWLADLGTLAAWWQERAGFSFQVSGEPGSYEVQARCSGQAVVLLKEAGGGCDHAAWRELPAGQRRIALEAEARPTIGLGPGVAFDAAEFLRNEGFAVEPRQGAHGLILEGPSRFGPEDERRLLAQAEAAPGPLVRFARWPRGVQSALALSMDVDSITLLDFMKRPLQR